MRKRLFSMLSLLILVVSLRAQLAINYPLSVSNGTYTSISATGTNIAAMAADNNQQNLTGLPGFTVNGVTYTNARVSSNGWIVLYGSTAPTSTTESGILATSVSNGSVVIAPMNADLNSKIGSAFYYEVIGNEIVFEWKSYLRYGYTDELNFQARLNTLNGSISFVYGTCTPDSKTSYFNVGWKTNGATASNWATDINNLLLDVTGSPNSCNWADAVTGNTNSSTVYFNSANSGVVPTNGLTLTWTVPVNPALAPVRVFSAVSNITSNSADISWTAPSGATQYNVQYRIPGTCSWTNYSGNPVSTNSVTLTGLNILTNYQVRVQSSDGTNNAIWSHIPNAAGTASGYNATGTFSTTGIPTDLQVVTMTNPAVNSTGCYGSSIPVVIQVKNAGSSVLDFSVNNATLITNITGTNPQSFTTTINTGTLAANATQNFTVTSTYDMSAIGTYSINASATLASPDANPANDVMPLVTRTTTSGTPAPYSEGFATATIPAGWINNSSWLLSTSHGVSTNGLYKNMWSSTTTATVTTLKLGTLTGNEGFAFDYRVLNYTSYPNGGVPTGNWGNIQVQVSSDCGNTFNTIGTIDNTTHTITTNAWTNQVFSLSSFSGQNVIIRFVATWVAGDYFVDIDNINVASCFAPTAITATNITTTTSDIAWTAPVTGTPAAYIYEVRTSGAAGSGTVGLATTGTVTAPSTSVTVTGLTSLTNYTVYVMSYCGGVDVSPWANSTFTTLANCPVPTSFTVTAITPTTANATWVAGGSETAWDVYYGPAPLSVPDATTVPTATSSTTSYSFTSLTPATDYVVYVRADCGGSESNWTPLYAFTTPCLPPNILTTTNSSRCGTGTTTLSATADAGATLQWYANTTGGAAIGTGTLFTTPTISTTTNYYVSAMGAPVLGNGARTAPTATSNTTPSSYGLVFDATKSFTLTSVDVFPTSTSGNLVVNLTDNLGAVLQTATVAIPTGTVGTPYSVNLNFPIVPGTGYRLIAVSGPSLIRESGLGGFPYAIGNVGNITSGYISGTSTTYYFFYNWKFMAGCEGTRSMVTASVTAPPVLTINSPASVCAGSGIATLSVTSTVSDYDSYEWTPTTGLYTDAAATTSYTGGNANTIYVNTTNVGVLNYNIAASNSVSGCATNATSSVSVLEAPTSITVVATPTALCGSGTVTISATANDPAPVVLLNEDFNAATNTWTTTNNSTGGTSAAAAWTLRNSPFTSSNVGTNLTSNDASQFYLTDSDAQGSGGTTSTLLQSPAINTMGMSSLTLSFYHYYHYYSDDISVKVEASSDGTNWNTIQDFTPGATDIGTATSFSLETFSLNSYTNNPTLYVRFNYSATWGFGWAIDNVKIEGVSDASYTYNWSSNPTGFAATTSTATDTPTATTHYSVVITNTNTSCSNGAYVTVNVTPIPTVTAVTSQSVLCDDGSSGAAILTASTTASSVLWNDGSTTTTISVTPTITTVYTVTATDAGCSADAYVTVTVSNCTGIDELSANGISLYPNPNNGIVNVAIPTSLTGKASIQIFDALGKLVITEVLNNESTTIHTNSLTNGIYMFKVISNNNTIKVGKIVKQ